MSDDTTLKLAPPVPADKDCGMEQPGDFIGPYRLLQKIGTGGFGDVWRAEQLKPIHREVALKVIKAGMDSAEIIARFAAERQALALMDHPNIAAVLDAGTMQSGRPYFAMELVKGSAITTYCNAHQLSVRQRLELFIPVCLAVQHAHQKAILHRDLKPSNILITEVDGKPVPKVIDFGIAKALGTSPESALSSTLARTRAGLLIGTPQYMSPEQAGSVPDVDTRSDIYALGIILYELLTGQTPLPRELWQQAALDEVLRLIREGEPQRPSSRMIPVTEAIKLHASERHADPQKLSRSLRGDLDWIVLMALEKERDRRYQTANALAQDIGRHLGDEPVSAGPPSAGYRLRKLVRRKKGVFIAGALVLLCLLAGITATSIALWREQKALVRETEQRELAVENEKRAKQEAENARRVAEFTQSLLSGAVAEVAGGKSADALIAAIGKQVQNLPEALGGQPEVELQVTSRLADIYQQFAMPREALPLIRRALSLARQVHPDEPERILAHLYKLAVSERQVGDGEAAIRLFKECLALRQTLGQTPENNAPAFRDLKDLAIALKMRGQAQEAQAAYGQAVTIYQDRERRGSLTEANHLYSYAGLLREAGRFEESLRIYRKVTSSDRTVTKDFDMTGAFYEQMNLERKMGHAEDAVRTCERAMELEKQKPAQETWKMADRLLGYATFLRDGKHWDKAGAVYAEALTTAERAGHPITLLKAHSEMRRFFEEQNKLEEAEAHARAAWDTGKKGNLGIMTASRQGDLIALLDKRKKYEEGRRLGDDLWKTLNNNRWAGEPPQLRSELINRIASLHVRWHDAAPSAELVKTVRMWRERTVKAINWERNVPDNDFSVMMLYQAWWMAVLIEDGRVVDYERERVRLLQRVKGTVHPEIAQRVARAALLLPAEGDVLSQTMTLADRAMQKGSGVAEGATTSSHLAKGLALYRAERFAESITTLNGALRDQQTHMWFATVAVMAMAHERLGHHADAVTLLDKAAKADPIKRAELESPVRRDEVSARVLLAEAGELIKH